MIYDNNLKTLERFEPHGPVTIGKEEFTTTFIFTSKIDNEIKKIFKSKVGLKTYFTPKDICPDISLQHMQECERLMNREVKNDKDDADPRSRVDKALGGLFI
jgi:hypothetical protein